MNCTHPARMFPTGYLTEKGKPEYFYDSHFSTFIPVSSLEKKWPERKWLRGLTDFIEVPCGKCAGCASDYARAWSLRLTAESLSYKPGEIWFFTFTYSDSEIPKDPKESKKDFSNFMRALRDYFKHDLNFRFYAVGELSPVKKRIHIHAIIFGFDFSKWRAKIPYDGKQFVFPMIEKLWSRGFCPGEPCNDVKGVSGYVFKYLLKDRENLVWKQGSLKPGIGLDYLRKLAYEMDPENPLPVYVPTGRGAVLVGSVPKAIRQQMDFSNSLQLESIYLRLFNQMIDAGYTEEEAIRYSFVEAYRESLEKMMLDKKAFKEKLK